MERKRGASRKLAETTQKHFLPVISASGDKVGILTPPRASSLGPMLIPQLWTGEGGFCLGDAPAGETKGLGQVWARGTHSSVMDSLWRKMSRNPLTAKDAIHKRSARLINSDSGLGVIRSDLSLQTEKSLSGLAGSSLCVHRGRSHTVWFINYGVWCKSMSFTVLGVLSCAAA